MHRHHKEILQLIESRSGKGTQHTLLDGYLGNSNPRYAITAPVLRTIARDWMRAHKQMPTDEFSELVGSLVKGKSSTEKCFAGMLMDNASNEQNSFNPILFDQWLDHLEGWAEIDSVCTGKYPIQQLLPQWNVWRKLLVRFSKDKNLNKRRASLVLLCSPLSKHDDERLIKVAFENIDRLKSHKEILITKAISWLLRSMVKHHKGAVKQYVKDNIDTLPKIAVRETMVKVTTGKKTR
jgi:3-methyladenine DNA glycosylase AlkD